MMSGAWEHYPFNQRLPCQLGPYWLEAELSAGGMGRVLRGHQRTGSGGFRLPRAVKVPLWDDLERFPDVVADLLHEAEVASTLDHVNLLKLLDFGEDHGVPYLVTDLLEGSDASKLGPLE